MKRLFLLITLLSLVFSIFAQDKASVYPMKYQAVVRNNAGQIIANQNVSFRISIIEDEPTGTVMFQEEHVGIATNDFGIVNLVIYEGDNVINNFGNIDFGSENYLQIELDVNGGTDYQLMGTSLLMYVPKALYAENAQTASTVDNEFQQLSIEGDELSISGTIGNTITLPSGLPDGSAGDILYSDGTDWMSSSILFHDTDNIGVGTNTPYGYFDVYTSTFAAPAINSFHGAGSDGTVAVRAKNIFNNYGYLGVFGSDDFEGVTSLDIGGYKIGVLGVSTLMNTAYGVYGYAKKYGGYFENSASGNNVALGGSDAALEVDGGAVFGTETNAVKVTDIIELTGTTDDLDYTNVAFPAGWTADNSAIIYCAIEADEDHWLINGFYYDFTSSLGYIAYVSCKTNGSGAFRIMHPYEPYFTGKPYRVILMRIQ